MPREGLWKRYTQAEGSQTAHERIQPRAQSTIVDVQTQVETPGPRQLISNAAADPSNFQELCSEPKLPAPPSSTVAPATASELLPKLRWANIGWYYHWGTKQYDFTRGKIAVGEVLSSVCKEIVRSIDWRDVFGDEEKAALQSGRDEGNENGWGSDGPDWDTWDTTYGQCLAGFSISRSR